MLGTLDFAGSEYWTPFNNLLRAQLWHLSNDPGNKGSNFFSYGAIRFSHVGMFSFSHKECTILKKGQITK